MKYITLLLCLFVFGGTARASFIPSWLWQMSLQADGIFYGNITAVDSNTFTLNVDECLTGQQDKTIKVKQFYNWTCAMRWAPYKEGQHVFLFLRKEKGDYKIMGGGGEGEMRMDGNTVFGESFIFEKKPSRLLAQQSPTDNSSFLRMDLDSLKRAVQSFRTCFGYSEKKRGTSAAYKTKCNEPDIAAKAAANSIFAAMEADFSIHLAQIKAYENAQR